MSTKAKSLEPAATRAIASDDPLAILVVTASASALNRPFAEAITNGAAAASIGRSSENWIASGGRGSSAARTLPAITTLLAIKHAIANSPARDVRRTPRRALGRRRVALVLTARMGLHQHEVGQVAALAMTAS
jgi:hypothetical protein